MSKVILNRQKQPQQEQQENRNALRLQMVMMPTNNSNSSTQTGQSTTNGEHRQFHSEAFVISLIEDALALLDEGDFFVKRVLLFSEVCWPAP